VPPAGEGLAPVHFECLQRGVGNRGYVAVKHFEEGDPKRGEIRRVVEPSRLEGLRGGVQGSPKTCDAASTTSPATLPIPKSTAVGVSSRCTVMSAGSRLRWTTPLAWAHSRASATSRAMANACWGGKGACSCSTGVSARPRAAPRPELVGSSPGKPRRCARAMGGGAAPPRPLPQGKDCGHAVRQAAPVGRFHPLRGTIPASQRAVGGWPYPRPRIPWVWQPPSVLGGATTVSAVGRLSITAVGAVVSGPLAGRCRRQTIPAASAVAPAHRPSRLAGRVVPGRAACAKVSLASAPGQSLWAARRM